MMRIALIIIGFLIAIKVLLWILNKYGKNSGTNPPSDNQNNDSGPWIY